MYAYKEFLTTPNSPNLFINKLNPEIQKSGSEVKFWGVLMKFFIPAASKNCRINDLISLRTAAKTPPRFHLLKVKQTST